MKGIGIDMIVDKRYVCQYCDVFFLAPCQKAAGKMLGGGTINRSIRDVNSHKEVPPWLEVIRQGDPYSGIGLQWGGKQSQSGRQEVDKSEEYGTLHYFIFAFI